MLAEHGTSLTDVDCVICGGVSSWPSMWVRRCRADRLAVRGRSQLVRVIQRVGDRIGALRHQAARLPGAVGPAARGPTALPRPPYTTGAPAALALGSSDTAGQTWQQPGQWPHLSSREGNDQHHERCQAQKADRGRKDDEEDDRLAASTRCCSCSQDQHEREDTGGPQNAQQPAELVGRHGFTAVALTAALGVRLLGVLAGWPLSLESLNG